MKIPQQSNRKKLIGLTGRSNTACGKIINDNVSLRWFLKLFLPNLVKLDVFYMVIHWLVRLLRENHTRFKTLYGYYIHNLHTHTSHGPHIIKLSYTVLQVPQ